MRSKLRGELSSLPELERDGMEGTKLTRAISPGDRVLMGLSLVVTLSGFFFSDEHVVSFPIKFDWYWFEMYFVRY